MHGFIVRIQTSILFICLSFISDNCALHAYSHDDQCDFRCRLHCLEVNGTCSDCFFWKWGAYCEHSCPENCLKIFGCDRLTGVCTYCRSGFYGSNCEPCPEHCKGGCDRLSGNCLVCPKGRYGPTCMDLCDHCATSCDRVNGVCNECEDGYFGEKCKESCPDHCAGKCNRGNGQCNFCKPGWYGPNCTFPCQHQCQPNATCDQITGMCESCFQGFYRSNTENKTCDETCPVTCLYRNCQSTTGYCNVCVNRKYGAGLKRCTAYCSHRCFGECDRDTGSCFACITGRYGQLCDKLCFWKCSSGCGRDGECFTCRRGYSGWNCEEKCPINCDGPCDRISKACLLCKIGYYGSTCSNTCPEHCTSGCHKVNGNCDGLNGPVCNMTCSHEIELQERHLILLTIVFALGGLVFVTLACVAMCLMNPCWKFSFLERLKFRATVNKEREFENKGFVCEKDHQFENDLIEDETAPTYATRASPDLSETRLKRSDSTRTTDDGSSYLSVDFGQDMKLEDENTFGNKEHAYDNKGLVCEKYLTDATNDETAATCGVRSSNTNEAELKLWDSQRSSSSSSSSSGSSYASVDFGKDMIRGMTTYSLTVSNYNNENETDTDIPTSASQSPALSETRLKRYYAQHSPNGSQRSSGGSSLLSVHFGKPRLVFESREFQGVAGNGGHAEAPHIPEREDLTISENSSPVSRARHFERDSQRSSGSSSNLSVAFGP